MSRVMCNMSHVFYFTNCWSLFVEGLLSTGHPCQVSYCFCFSPNYLITKVFVKQPLALPGSAKNCALGLILFYNPLSYFRQRTVSILFTRVLSNYTVFEDGPAANLECSKTEQKLLQQMNPDCESFSSVSLYLTKGRREQYSH